MDKITKMQEKLERFYEEVREWEPLTAWDEANQRSLRQLKRWVNRLEKAIERHEQRSKGGYRQVTEKAL